jgi:uncharacterized protein YbaR (Trm112 family)
MGNVNEELLALLVCPMGKARLRCEGDTLICTRCGPRFSIKDDIPDMLIEDAELPPGCTGLADLECVRSGDAKLDHDSTPSSGPATRGRIGPDDIVGLDQRGNV